MKNKITQAVTIVVIIVGLGVAGYFGYKEIRKAVSGGETKFRNDIRNLVSDTQDNPQTYTHPDYGFTFNYPPGFTLGRFPEGEGEIVLLQGNPPQPSLSQREGENSSPSQDKDGDSPSPLAKGRTGGVLGFQLFITAYEENKPLSFELIKEQAKELNPNNEKTIVLDEGEITALSFDSESDSGKTREIWFEAYGNLYQATSFPEFGDSMEKIIETIRFN